MSVAWPEGILIDRPASSRAMVIALHGFTRRGRHLQRLAEHLVAEDLTVLRPTLRSLWWPRSMNRRPVVAELADRLGPVFDGQPIAIVGHSAGAAAGACLAARLIEAGTEVSGLVFVDGVESPTRHVANAWSSIRACDLRVVAAPPSPCNRHGELVRWLVPRMVGPFGIEIAHSGHGDVEGESHRVYRLACRERSTDETRARVMHHVVAATLRVIGHSPLTHGAEGARQPGDVVLVGTRSTTGPAAG